MEEGLRRDARRSSTARGAIVSDAWSKSKDKGVGDKIVLTTPTGARSRYTIEGTDKDNADLLGDITVTNDALAARHSA